MNEIDAVINRTKDISKENRQNIDVLVRELSKFRVYAGPAHINYAEGITAGTSEAKEE
jgi:hypothetical protein